MEVQELFKLLRQKCINMQVDQIGVSATHVTMIKMVDGELKKETISFPDINLTSAWDYGPIMQSMVDKISTEHTDNPDYCSFNTICQDRICEEGHCNYDGRPLAEINKP